MSTIDIPFSMRLSCASGASVHHVTAEYDEGPVIGTQELLVRVGDTVESLSSRVLEAEHHLLPAVVKR
jgi:phosphoribosylglycinamide formyltransferase-1